MGTKDQCSSSCRAGHRSAPRSATPVVGLTTFRNCGVKYNVTLNSMIKCMQFCSYKQKWKNVYKEINPILLALLDLLVDLGVEGWELYHALTCLQASKHTVSETAREEIKSAETSGHFINCKNAMAPSLPRPVIENKSDFTRRNSFTYRLLS